MGHRKIHLVPTIYPRARLWTRVVGTKNPFTTTLSAVEFVMSSVKTDYKRRL